MQELLGFFKKEFISDVTNIRESLGFVNDSLNETCNNLKEAIGVCVDNRDFEKIGKIAECIKEIDKIQDKLEAYCSLLDPETDVEKLYGWQNKKDEEVPEREIVTDSSKQYSLETNFTFTKPTAFIFEGVKIFVNDWRGLLLKSCGMLYERDKGVFESFIDNENMQGRKAVYFSRNPEVVRSPFLVNGSDIYVTTNMSANAISNLILSMLEKYRINSSNFKVCLRVNKE
jgi:hypothetical protein